MIGCTELICGTAPAGEGAGAGAPGSAAKTRPIVVWNATRRCNLRCSHCYIDAEAGGRDELSTREARALVEDAAHTGCPVVLFSGGEPTLREDLCDLGRLAVRSGARAAISSNGTTIDDETARRIADAGFSYVGVSIDGAPGTHDGFRGMKGAFDAAVRGIRNCLRAGVKSGVRFTVTSLNAADLPYVLDLVEREGIPRFCMYHLVYAGRGKGLMPLDLPRDETRRVMGLLIEKVLDWRRRGIETEILTTDNPADGVLIEDFLRTHRPERLEEPRPSAGAQAGAPGRRHRGCSAGRKIASVDHVGDVHPCQFWTHATLGNVRERPLSRIWADESNPLMSALRSMPGPLTGPRCSRCRSRATCGGCRVRAEAANGDPWSDDPACYLTDAETCPLPGGPLMRACLPAQRRAVAETTVPGVKSGPLRPGRDRPGGPVGASGAEAREEVRE